MQFKNTDINTAQKLDSQDELASFRDEFIINDPELIYLNGNSLGRLPKRTVAFMQNVIEHEWGEKLIRSWNDDWIDVSTKLGSKIAELIGAQPDEVLVTSATSINLFKLVTAALLVNSNRTKIVSDVFNFPSDLYILQGIIELLGKKHQLELITSDDGITISPKAVTSAISKDTALVCLTHVAFKSSFMYNMENVTEEAHKTGALMLWDLSHSVGAVPFDLNSCNVDLAVGSTYKYLNGGPGSPAFLYVRRDLQKQLHQPIWGWFGSKEPFAFEQNFTPASGISRFKIGTPPILSMKALEPAIDLLLEARIERLRAKSIKQTEYLIYLAKQWLTPLNFEIKSPLNGEMRGSHVSISHPEAYRINRTLIESPSPAIKVISGFREPDNIRLGTAPIYTTFTEIYKALDRICTIVNDKVYEKYSTEKQVVT